MKKGSITVFASISMMLILSCLFILLEASRVYGLSQYAKWKTKQAVQNIAAEYQPYMWKEYNLLVFDSSYGKEEFSIGRISSKVKEKVDENLNEDLNKWKHGGIDLLQLKLEKIFEPKYVILTDQNGDVFLNYIAKYMKKNLPQEIASEIYEHCKEQNNAEEKNGDVIGTIDKAQQMLEEERKKQETKEEGQTKDRIDNQPGIDQGGQPIELEENPLEVAQEVQKAMKLSTLGLVIDDVNTISTKRISQEETLEQREKCVGNTQMEIQSDWYQKVLVMAYIDRYFASYSNTLENHSLSYEIEYLLLGNKEERKNLEGAVNRLLLTREAANVTYLLTDSEKMNQAEIIANVLAGFTGNPAIIKAVKVAIVGAWAFIESVQDLRTLLSGGKIALIKGREQWTTDVSHLTESLQKNAKAKECNNGISYQQYLTQSLFFMNNEQLAYRMMDVMEQNISESGDYSNAKMDHMIVSFEYQLGYSADPLFTNLSILGSNKIKSWYFEETAKFSYIP